MEGMTEQNYLEMAEEFKEVVEDKDKIIEFLKSKINNFDRDLRKLEYRIIAMKHLLEFEKSKAKAKSASNDLFNFLMLDLDFLYKYVDSLRTEAQEEIDDELILIIENNVEDE